MDLLQELKAHPNCNKLSEHIDQLIERIEAWQPVDQLKANELRRKENSRPTLNLDDDYPSHIENERQESNSLRQELFQESNEIQATIKSEFELMMNILDAICFADPNDAVYEWEHLPCGISMLQKDSLLRLTSDPEGESIPVKHKLQFNLILRIGQNEGVEEGKLLRDWKLLGGKKSRPDEDISSRINSPISKANKILRKLGKTIQKTDRMSKFYRIQDL